MAPSLDVTFLGKNASIRAMDSSNIPKLKSLHAEYRDADEVLTSIINLAKRYSSFMKVYKLGKTLQGRDILALKLSKSPSKNLPNLPEILYVGVHHAREWIALEVPLQLAEHIAWQYQQGHATVRRLVDSSEIWIVPLLNADGYQYSHQKDRWWRKNMRSDATRLFGVDLNRNYPSSIWAKLPAYDESWQKDTEVYRGVSPFSEPETTAMLKLMGGRTSEEPNAPWVPSELNLTDGFTAVISYHSYGQQIMWPPGDRYEKSPNFEMMKAMGEEYARIMKAVSGRQYSAMPAYGLYLAIGDFCDWFHYHHDYRVCYTIELPGSESSPWDFNLPVEEIAPTVHENIAGALWFADYMLTATVPADKWADHTFDPAIVSFDVDSDGVVDYVDGELFKAPVPPTISDRIRTLHPGVVAALVVTVVVGLVLIGLLIWCMVCLTRMLRTASPLAPVPRSDAASSPPTAGAPLTASGRLDRMIDALANSAMVLTGGLPPVGTAAPGPSDGSLETPQPAPLAVLASPKSLAAASRGYAPLSGADVDPEP